MLNSKFKTIFVAMRLEIDLIVFYLKANNNTKPIKFFFQVSYRLATVGRFY